MRRPRPVDIASDLNYENVSARTSPATWELLLSLISSANISATVVNSILRKHNFIDTIGKALSESVVLAQNVKIDGATVKKDESSHIQLKNSSEILETVSQTFSTTECGSLPIKAFLTCTSDTSDTELPVNERICKLLGAIFGVMTYLENGSVQPKASVGNTKRTKLEAASPVLHGSPEVGTNILKWYFELLVIASRSEQSLADSSDEWTIACISIWKSCIYGYSNFSKVCTFILFCRVVG